MKQDIIHNGTCPFAVVSNTRITPLSLSLVSWHPPAIVLSRSIPTLLSYWVLPTIFTGTSYYLVGEVNEGVVAYLRWACACVCVHLVAVLVTLLLCSYLVRVSTHKGWEGLTGGRTNVTTATRQT